MPTKSKSATAVKQFGADPSAPDRPASSPAAKRWTVTIPYVPPTLVEAGDEAEAWEKFKTKWGIVKSEHVPAIRAESGD